MSRLRTNLFTVKNMQKMIGLFFFLFSVLGSTVLMAAENLNPAAVKKARAYPGGQDEEDLKVQEDLRVPTLTVDRRTIEQKVLKGYIKKTETEEESPANKSQ